jgi:hypothetical protein
MTPSKTNAYFAIKIFSAIAMLSAIVGVAGADLAPGVSLISILVTCAIAAAIFLILLIIGIIGGGLFNQYMIRRGGTDTSWLWFKGEPPGLEKLRDELKEFKDTK